MLPALAESMRPVDMDGAAELLGVERDSFVEIVRDHPHYERRRGNKKVFYPEHIKALALLLKIETPKTQFEALRKFFASVVRPAQVPAALEFFARPVEGKVYFIRCADRVKIGFAGDFTQRLRVLKTSCPFPVEIIAVVDGDRDLELLLHRSFVEYRRHGEWFEETGELLILTTALKAV